MWILPTYKRPEKCQALLEHINTTSPHCKGVVIVNGCEGYDNLRIPHNWYVQYVPENLGLCGAMNYAFAQYPNELNYGLITDDEWPVTRDWARTLEFACGDWQISHANDSRQSSRRIHALSCMGGKLVREMGYICPPGLWHWYADDAWELMAAVLNLRVWCPTVMSENNHYLYGKSEKDETYALGESRAEQDKQAFIAWANDSKTHEMLKRIANKIGQDYAAVSKVVREARAFIITSSDGG